MSQTERVNRGLAFMNYAMFGADNPTNAALYNKTYAYLDDLQSLLYSPVSLRFHIGDDEYPNILNQAKGRAAAAHLRKYARASDTDTMISEAVLWGLIKGKTVLKQTFKRGTFAPTLIQPEGFGVLRENHCKLDEDMEAFTHSMLITPYQFSRLIANHPDRADLERKAKRYIRQEKNGLTSADSAMRQVVVGGLYPFQAAGSTTPNNTRGIVDWMGGTSPMLSTPILQSLMQLDEVWVWDDNRRDWVTFQIIGGDMLITGKYMAVNSYAFNPVSKQENPDLKGKHPFHEFSPNPIDNYFWGRSEIINVALLQEAINSRLNGINRLLRRQEDPPTKFIGSSGVNQNSIARLNKPGGWWAETNPNAKVDQMAPTIPPDLWASLHEYERMFDDMGGLPPIARGHGESGVRSGSHADTLVRMFSPRFKDRALLVERDVEGLGGSMLDLAKANVDKKLVAWVSGDQAGPEADAIKDPLIVPPFKGAVAIRFAFADLPNDVTLTIDSHSSSPAFSQDATKLAFDLLKVGAFDAEDLIDHTDSPDPEQLIPGVQRRGIARAEAEEKAAAMKVLHGGRPKGH